MCCHNDITQLKTLTMKIIKLLLASCLIINVSSCNKEHVGLVIGRGSSTSTTLDKTDFSGIDLSIPANVTYTQDSVYSVVISAQSNVQKVIEFKNEGSILKITSRKGIIRHNPINITIHSPSINSLAVSGSGKIEVQGQIITNALDLDVSGSGKITLPFLKTQSIKTSVSGSGNITVSGGTADSEYLTSSGSGNTKLEDLESKQSDAQASGSGNISLWCTQKLNARLSGSGKISYRGSPEVNSHTSGSGKIVRLD